MDPTLGSAMGQGAMDPENENAPLPFDEHGKVSEVVQSDNGGGLTVPGTGTRKTVLLRQTAIQNPMMMDAMRRVRLGLKGREVAGKLTFVVHKSQSLSLPPSVDDASASAVRETLCRRFDSLHPSRKEDDASYFDAVENDTEVTLIAALPPGYEEGGWRCHEKTCVSGEAACLHANGAEDEICEECRCPKPSLRPGFAYLRLLPSGLRCQRREYERIIQHCDHELDRCDAAEHEATDRIATFDREIQQALQEQDTDSTSTAYSDTAPSENEEESSDLDAEEELMMDIDLQGGVWQRVNARKLLPMLATRKIELNDRLTNARAELSIMIQSAFELAVPHVQRVTRRFLVRARLDAIRKSMLDLARVSASVEIQRMMRSKLARKEADRLRVLRNHLMATRIQSLARRGFAIAERKRLYAIWLDKLRHKSATIIQGLYRCYAAKLEAKLLAEERRRRLEELQKARQASLEKDAATSIQKHCRRILAKELCSNRRIELRLHRRILMYLERFVVDGCMWSFVKSINDDYIRYERTISHTIEREEKMAKTFVEKVINARDGDHSSAWENYIHLTHKGTLSAEDPGFGNTRNTKPSSKSKTTGKFSNHHAAMKIYRSPRNISSRKSETRVASRKSCESIFHPLAVHVSTEESETTLSCSSDDVGESRTRGISGVAYRQEAKRLSSMKQIKDGLKGQYLRFDIPDGLDDTVARFIMAVTLRYKFETPCESSVHGNFELAFVEKEHQQKCMMYAEPLIQLLHGKGVVFIRQLLPTEHMTQTLRKLGVPESFCLLSISLLNVLYQITGGNFLNRRYLMKQSRNLLDTQKQMKITPSAPNSITSFLGGCGATDDFDDGDNPGGLWTPKVTLSEEPADCSVLSEGKCPHVHPTTTPVRKTRNRSWVIPYTAKIINENETKHPALGPYRRGQLLDHQSSNAENVELVL